MDFNQATPVTSEKLERIRLKTIIYLSTKYIYEPQQGRRKRYNTTCYLHVGICVTINICERYLYLCMLKFKFHIHYRGRREVVVPTDYTEVVFIVTILIYSHKLDALALVI